MGVITGPQGCIIKSVTPSAYNAAVNSLQKSVDFLNKSLNTKSLNNSLETFRYYSTLVAEAKEDLAALGGVSVSVKQPTVIDFSFTGSTKIHLLKVTESNFDVPHINTTLNGANMDMLEFESQLDVAVKSIEEAYTNFVEAYNESESGDSSYSLLIQQIRALITTIAQGAHLNNEQLQAAAEEASDSAEVEMETVVEKEPEVTTETITDPANLDSGYRGLMTVEVATEVMTTTQAEAKTKGSDATAANFANMVAKDNEDNTFTTKYSDGSTATIEVHVDPDTGEKTTTYTVVNAANGHDYVYTTTTHTDGKTESTVSVDGGPATPTSTTAQDAVKNNADDRTTEYVNAREKADAAEEDYENALTRLETEGYYIDEDGNIQVVGEPVNGDTANSGEESGIGGGLSIEEVENDFDFTENMFE